MSDNEKKNIEYQLEELHKVNGYMKLLIENTNSIFMLLDRDANILYCNDSILPLLGIDDTSEIIGKPLNEINGIYEDAEYFKRSISRYKRLLSGEADFTEDDVINWPNKGERIFQITHKLVQNSDGGPQLIALILRDVTDERIDEDNQRIAERLQATQMACLVWDEDGHMVNCNREALRLFGFPDDLPPDQYDNIIYIQPKYQPDGNTTEFIRQKFISEAISKGYSHIDVILTKNDGTHMPMDVMGVRVSWQYGHRVFVYYRDLTEVKAKEAEAKEAEERIKIMLDSTPLICILRNENNEVIDCNKEALNIFGVSKKEDFITRFQEFYPEFQPDGQKSSDKIIEYLSALHKKRTIEFEWMYKTASGDPLPVKTTLVSIVWNGANSFLSYSRDLRKEKANEQKMRESIEQARQLELQKEKAKVASEAKSQFLASMSHEIRTPMNTIIGLLELLRTDNLDSEQISQIKDIRLTSAVLLQIINDILDFHRIEAGKLEILPKHFNLNMFYNELVSRYNFVAASKQITFNSSLAPDLPRSVFGDELRINQIVTNLLSNALKYTRKGYVNFSVDSALENGKEYMIFTVEDSGIGIKEENFAKIFDEFEQFDTHKNRGIAGTGLGLPIANRLAKLMDGHVRFKSEYGKGSVFTFTLPLIKGDLEKVEHTDEIERVMAKPDTKILVVDDNEGNIAVAVGLLARHGILPQTANNGVQAIEMIKTNKYDLVFMDHMMPDMDGAEATANIRKLDGEYYTKLPIIALSANAVAGARELFYSSGMNDFVAKPIDSKDLNRALLHWLPQEKIMAQKPKEDIVEHSNGEDELDSMLEELVKIQDLSIYNGLSRTGGDKKLYAAILWQFCNSADMYVKELKNFAKNNLWKDYAISVHALKTVFANIGNQFLSDWAFSLEEAALREDANKCANETIPFCNALTLFYIKLSETDLMKTAAIKASKKIISSETLKSKLEQLLLACEDFQAEAAEQIAIELMDVTFQAKVDALLANLYDLVHSFDYDKVTPIIGELIKVIESI